ncbi:MAG: cation transporter [Hyphomonadaceae bacterium]|nr:cation transporter [Hyphomonadaceae bacterium]
MASETHSVTGRVAPEEAARITRAMALMSVSVALLLIGIKTWAYLASGSVAMLSALADSTLDFAASLFTFFAVRYAAAPPDREHRYGHGKAEAFAGLFQAGLVLASAGIIVFEAVKHIVSPHPITHGAEGVVVMLVSIALTGALITAQTRAIRRTGSLATSGDRAHYAADLAANIVVIGGIAAGAFLQASWIDALAGLAVAGWLVWGAWGIARAAGDHLMDREMSEADRARIKALAMQDPALGDVHDLRTRMSGPLVHIQFHADLDPDMTLEEAHRIVVAAENRIREAFPAADIIIHPDPKGRAEPHGHEYFSEGRRAEQSA